MLTQSHRRFLLRICLVAVAIIPVLFAASLFTPIYHEVCEKNQYTGHDNCATYHIALAWLVYVGDYGNTYGVFVSAVATMAIAAFTWTLWLATEQQAAITNSALALAREEFNATHRPKLRIRYIKLAIRDGKTSIQYLVVNTGVGTARIKQHTILIAHKKSNRKPHQIGCFELAGGEDRIVEFDLAETFDDTFDVLNLKARGTIEYEDGIGTKRRTGFAGTYDSKLDWFRRSEDPEEEYED